MTREPNKRSSRVARRATRSKTQAIFFDRSSVSDDPRGPAPYPDAVVETGAVQKTVPCPGQNGLVDGRMFAFSELLGIFSHFGHKGPESSKAPGAAKDPQTSDIVAERRRGFELLIEGSTSPADRGGPRPPHRGLE